MIGSQYLYFIAHNLSCRLGLKCTPLLAGFKITHRCNLRCRTCPYWRRPGDDIPYEKAIEVMDRLHDAGVRLLIFEGGEPFIWRDGDHSFEDLASEAKKRFFSVGVTTNGILPLRTDAHTVWVSIDGLRETHNLIRGPVFDKVIENIRASSHPKLFANITINRLNVEEVPALVRFLSEIPQIKGVTIQFFYPYQECEDLTVTPGQRVQVLESLIEMKRQGYPLLDSLPALRALERNTWPCHDQLMADAEPDGTINLGCYLKNRGDIDCGKCGFAAHTELSLAYDGVLPAINAGRKVFGFH